MPADDIRTLAREIAAAPSAAVYGRIGTCTVEFGTLASWLVDVINILTGNLDRPGGAMFAAVTGSAPRRVRRGPAAGSASAAGTAGSRGIPRQSPNCRPPRSAEEIDTAGDGQIKALITIAGNPVLSAPNGDRLDARWTASASW